jgi:hypothetical protein
LDRAVHVAANFQGVSASGTPMMVEASRAGSTGVRHSGAGLTVEVVFYGLRLNPPAVGVNLSEASEYLRR